MSKSFPFWKLEDDILREIFSQWLQLADFCLLDQAHCNRQLRAVFLNYLKESAISVAIPSLNQSRCFALYINFDYNLFSKWVSLRGLVISRAVFSDNEDGILPQNFDLLRLRESAIILTNVHNMFPMVRSLIPIVSKIEALEIHVSQIPVEVEEFSAYLCSLLSSSSQLKSLSISGLLSLSASELLSLLRRHHLDILCLPHNYFLHSLNDFFSPDNLFQCVKEFWTLSTLSPQTVAYETMFKESHSGVQSIDMICTDCSLCSIHSSLDIVTLLSHFIHRSGTKPTAGISCGIGTVIPFALASSYSSMPLLSAHSEMFEQFLSIGAYIGAHLKDLSLSLAYFDNRNEPIMELPCQIFPSVFAVTGNIDDKDISLLLAEKSLFSLCPHLEELTLNLFNHPLKTLHWQIVSRNCGTRIEYFPTLQSLAWNMFVGDIPIHLHNLRVLSIRRTSSDVDHGFRMKKPLLHEISDKHVWEFSESLARGCPLLEKLDVSHFPLLITALYGLQHLHHLSVENLSGVFATADDAFPYYSVVHERYRDAEGKENCDQYSSIPHHFPSLVSVSIHDYSDRCIYRLLEIFCCGVAPRLRSLELQGLGPFFYRNHFIDFVDEDEISLDQDWERIPGACEYVYDKSYIEYERVSSTSASTLGEEDVTDLNVFHAKRRPVLNCTTSFELQHDEKEDVSYYSKKLERFLSLPTQLRALLEGNLKNCPDLRRIRLKISEKNS